MHKWRSHGRISHGCSVKYCPRCWKQERVISGHSSSVTIVKIISLSRENLGRVDYTAPVYLFMTGIVDFDTHSSLLLIEVFIENCNKRRRVHRKLFLQLTKRVSTRHPIVATVCSKGPICGRVVTSVMKFPTVDHTAAGAVRWWTVIMSQRWLYYLYLHYILT